MGFYAGVIGGVRQDLQKRAKLAEKIKATEVTIAKLQEDLLLTMNAQSLLGVVSDKNTEVTLNFVTGVINKALAEVFPNEYMRVQLARKVHGSGRVHINAQLLDEEGNELEMDWQVGTGLRQIVSALYTICLIEIRKGRRLIILDERFSGLHLTAKSILEALIRIFSESGFQFVFVEYGFDDLGKIYNVEKPGNEARMYALEDEPYDPRKKFIFSEVDLSVLDENYKEEYDEEE